jgi:hypothetical protein
MSFGIRLCSCEQKHARPQDALEHLAGSIPAPAQLPYHRGAEQPRGKAWICKT